MICPLFKGALAACAVGVAELLLAPCSSRINGLLAAGCAGALAAAPGRIAGLLTTACALFVGAPAVCAAGVAELLPPCSSRINGLFAAGCAVVFVPLAVGAGRSGAGAGLAAGG